VNTENMTELGKDQRIAMLEGQVADMEIRLRDTAAGAAAMRGRLILAAKGFEDDIAEMDVDGVGMSELKNVLERSLERDKAALSATAGVAMLERVRELEETLAWALKHAAQYTAGGYCNYCSRDVARDGRQQPCEYRKAQELITGD